MTTVHRTLRPLTAGQVMQLRQLVRAFPRGVDHGDVAGKCLCKDLIELGLASRDSKTYNSTNDGRVWVAESEGGGSAYVTCGAQQ